MIRNNQALMAEIDRICEVAGYLWEKGWAERNGGNISVNITELLTEAEKNLPALAPATQLQEVMGELGGHFFYVTGTGASAVATRDLMITLQLKRMNRLFEKLGLVKGMPFRIQINYNSAQFDINIA